MRKYYSSYTGQQIDEAVRAIVDNQIKLEDLSPELVAEIKKWIAEGQNTGQEVRELEFDLRSRFPEPGNPDVLYIAIDEDRIYYWSGNNYREIKTGAHDEIIDRLVQVEEDVVSLKQFSNEQAAKNNSIDASILSLTRSLENKADKSLVNDMQALVGVRNSGDSRTIFDILYQQEDQISLNISEIQGLSAKTSSLETGIKGISSELKSLAAQSRKVKYEILPVDGLIVDYRDTEIRLNTERVVPTHQSVGESGNPNMYYVTFRAYAPEGAESVIEGNNNIMDTESSQLSVDSYGRKYTTIWAAIANYSNGEWTKWGDNSTLDKYFGFLYSFNWLDANDNVIQMDKVRVLLTNDACHTDLVPDVIARRIDEKIKEISMIDLSNYYTKDEVNELIPTLDDIRDIVNDIAENDETFDETIDNKLEEKLDNYVQFGEEEIILYGGDA